jgi:hypothetical protein
MTKQPSKHSLPETWNKEKHRLSPEIVQAVELASKMKALEIDKHLLRDTVREKVNLTKHPEHYD